MRKILYVLAGVGLLICAAGLHYALPRVSVVQIVGVEVKRVDGEGGTRDVYMLQTQIPDGDRVRVFRNEDAILYLKLNSADLQARAAAFSRGEPLRSVAVRHYGWRIPLLSVFPNAVSAWEVEPGYRHVPVLNILVIAALLTLPLLAWRRLRGRVGVIRTAKPRTGTPPAPEGAPRGPDVEDWLSADQGTSRSQGGGGHDA